MYAPQANRCTRYFYGISIADLSDGALQNGLSVSCSADGSQHADARDKIERVAGKAHWFHPRSYRTQSVSAFPT